LDEQFEPQRFFAQLARTYANTRSLWKACLRAWCPVQPFREFQRKLRGSVVLNAAPESGVPFSDTISGCWRQSHPPKTSPVLFFQATISSNISSPNYTFSSLEKQNFWGWWRWL
jgi:hypothetical protein